MVSQGGVGSSGPLFVPPSQVSGASGVTKPANPLFKPPKYDGSKCLETFLLQFNYFASYMRWEEPDKSLHMCASLEGPAGHVFWELPRENPTTQDIERLLQARFGTQLQAESYKAKLRNRRRGEGESLQDLYRDISRLIQLAHPGEGDKLVKYIGVESFINALDDRYLRLEILKLKPKDLEEAASHAIRLEALVDSVDGKTTDSKATVADGLLPAPALCSQWLMISRIRAMTLTS